MKEEIKEKIDKLLCFLGIHNWGVKFWWLREKDSDPYWLECFRCGKFKLKKVGEEINNYKKQ